MHHQMGVVDFGPPNARGCHLPDHGTVTAVQQGAHTLLHGIEDTVPDHAHHVDRIHMPWTTGETGPLQQTETVANPQQRRDALHLRKSTQAGRALFRKSAPLDPPHRRCDPRPMPRDAAHPLLHGRARQTSPRRPGLRHPSARETRLGPERRRPGPRAAVLHLQQCLLPRPVERTILSFQLHLGPVEALAVALAEVSADLRITQQEIIKRDFLPHHAARQCSSRIHPIEHHLQAPRRAVVLPQVHPDVVVVLHLRPSSPPPLSTATALPQPTRALSASATSLPTYQRSYPEDRSNPIHTIAQNCKSWKRSWRRRGKRCTRGRRSSGLISGTGRSWSERVRRRH